MRTKTIFPYKNIFVRLDECQGYHIEGATYFSSSLYFPVGNTFGEPVLYKRSDQSIQTISLHNPRTLRYKFHDENQLSVNLNNSSWSMILSPIKK